MPKASKQGTAMRAAAKEISELNALELHALAHLGKGAAKVRDALEVGDAQPVDFCLRVSGAVNVGEGQTQGRTCTPKPLTMLALVLAALKPEELQRVTKQVGKQCAGFVESGEEPLVTAPAHDLACALLECSTHPTTCQVRGNVTAAVRMERLAQPKAKRAA
ncbi:MAG: hypothetical protein AB7O62_00290 [Pirellulales bacterium]